MFYKGNILEEQARNMAQDPKCPDIVDNQAMIDGSSDFDEIKSVLSTLIEDPTQEHLDPFLSEELQNAIINMEGNHDVR